MKTTLKIVFIVVTLLSTMAVSAQKINKKAMEKINEQVQEMVDVMGLDKDQQAKVLEIKKDQALERAKISKEMDRNSDEFKAKMKELNKASWEKVKAVCTKEQLKKWSKREKE